MTYQLKPATANSQVLKEVPVAPLSAPTPNVKKQTVTSLAPATPNKPSAKTSEEIIKDNTDWAKGTGKYAPTASSTSTPSTPSTPQPTDFTYVPKTDTKKTDTKVTAYKPTDKGILNASEDSLNAAKFDQLLSSKNKDIVNAQNEYAK